MNATGYKLAILGGAGLMGAGIVRDLISERTLCNLLEIRICDRDTVLTQNLIADLNDDRLSAFQLDAGKTDDIARAIDGCDVCINAVPTLAGYQMSIFETCLNKGCDYVDLGGLGVFTTKQLAWRERFAAAGVVAVIGTGADPGMSNMLCRAVADSLDTIDKINLYWAAEAVGPENPVLVPPYSISTVLAEYAHPSVQFLNGEHVECPPMTGNEFIDLPPPWGRTEFIYSPHSEQLTVPLAAGIAEKGIKEFTWKLHLPHREHEAWIGLVKAGFGDFDKPVELRGISIKPIDFLTAIIQRNIVENAEKMPDQEGHEIHFAIGEGTVDGQHTRVKWEVTVNPSDMHAPYVDAATSMNTSISTQLLLTSDRKPGVWAPEEYFASSLYFDEVRRREMTVASSVESLPAITP